MTRDQLEAVIRRELTTRDRQRAITDGPYADNALTDRILSAADAYAAATVGEFHRTRQATAITGPVVHWRKAPGSPAAACHGHRTTARLTSDPAAVTCGTCRQSRAWREAQEAAA